MLENKTAVSSAAILKFKQMGTLTNLPPRFQEYYINVRRWKTDLDFYNVEVVFLSRLMEECFLQMVGDDRRYILKQLGDKLSVLINEKHQISNLLDLQLENLVLFAEHLANENQLMITKTQSNLEYEMIDLIHQYREVKREVYFFMQLLLDESRLLAN